MLKAIASMNNYHDWSPNDSGLKSFRRLYERGLARIRRRFDYGSGSDPGIRGAGPSDRRRYRLLPPIPERVDKAAKMAINWGRLKHKPNAEKKVAIIFHNYPPRNDRIGCAFGLDSAASVLNILRDMREAGYVLEALPQDGQELIENIIQRVSNDRRWSSPEQMARLAVDGVSPEEYDNWFASFPSKIQEQMTHDWGKSRERCSIMTAVS